MYSAEYSKRLSQFNNTEKYKAELNFLEKLLELETHHSVLDYGCGIGTAVLRMSETARDVRGFDVNVFDDSVIPSCKVWRGGPEKFDRIYFMHSLAHIPNVKDVLHNLKENHLAPAGRIVVITPNKVWLRKKNGGKDLKSDDTVIEHFTLYDLLKLFQGIGMTCEHIGQYSHDALTDFPDATRPVKERLYFVAS